MDYSKLTKQELLQLVMEQAPIVEVVKDREKKSLMLRQENQELKNELDKMKNLEQVLKNKETQIESFKQREIELQDYYKKQIEQQEVLIKEQAEKITKERNIDEIIKQNELLRKDAEFAVDVANKYINTFRNYLKFQQGALDNMIEMEALLTKQIQTKEV